MRNSTEPCEIRKVKPRTEAGLSGCDRQQLKGTRENINVGRQKILKGGNAKSITKPHPPSATSTHLWNTSKDSNSTASSGSLFQSCSQDLPACQQMPPNVLQGEREGYRLPRSLYVLYFSRSLDFKVLWVSLLSDLGYFLNINPCPRAANMKSHSEVQKQANGGILEIQIKGKRAGDIPTSFLSQAARCHRSRGSMSVLVTLHLCLLPLPCHGSTSRSAAPSKLSAAASPRASGSISLPPPPTHGGFVVSSSALCPAEPANPHHPPCLESSGPGALPSLSGHLETHQGCAVPLLPRSAGDKALPTAWDWCRAAAFGPSDNPRDGSAGFL